MPRLTRSRSCPPTPGPDSLSRWEPALTQLRLLSPTDLLTVAREWLLACHFSSLQLCERRGSYTTFGALMRTPTLRVPLRVRIIQRKNRLQAHHVEAFAGSLIRLGVPVGVLVTTGAVSPEAIKLASTCTLPHLCLLSGEQWAAQLATQKAGLSRRQLWRWILELPARLCTGVSRTQKPKGRVRW